MRLAVPVKAISQRFALPVLVFASVVMIILGKADALLFERIRIIFADAAAPVLAAVSRPAAAENARLRELLHLAPDPAISFVSTRVIANSGGSFVRSVLVDAGRSEGLARGQAAMTGSGLVGRVTEVGEHAARVLLLTDLNSRVPVAFDGSRERAVLAGDNSNRPRLVYLPEVSAVKIGDRIVSSGNGGIFPPGLPIGVVAAIEDGIVRVEPYAELSRLDYLRIVNYGLNGVLPQPVAPRAVKPRGSAREAVGREPAP